MAMVTWCYDENDSHNYSNDVILLIFLCDVTYNDNNKNSDFINNNNKYNHDHSYINNGNYDNNMNNIDGSNKNINVNIDNNINNQCW